MILVSSGRTTLLVRGATAVLHRIGYAQAQSQIISEDQQMRRTHWKKIKLRDVCSSAWHSVDFYRSCEGIVSLNGSDTIALLCTRPHVQLSASNTNCTRPMECRTQ